MGELVNGEEALPGGFLGKHQALPHERIGAKGPLGKSAQRFAGVSPSELPGEPLLGARPPDAILPPFGHQDGMHHGSRVLFLKIEELGETTLAGRAIVIHQNDLLRFPSGRFPVEGPDGSPPIVVLGQGQFPKGQTDVQRGQRGTGVGQDDGRAGDPGVRLFAQSLQSALQSFGPSVHRYDNRNFRRSFHDHPGRLRLLCPNEKARSGATPSSLISRADLPPSFPRKRKSRNNERPGLRVSAALRPESYHFRACRGSGKEKRTDEGNGRRIRGEGLGIGAVLFLLTRRWKKLTISTRLCYVMTCGDAPFHGAFSRFGPLAAEKAPLGAREIHR